jgi:hypothetical protein
MFQRLLLGFFVILAIVAANVWHQFAGWFAHTQGVLPSLLLLVIVYLVGMLLDR